MKKMRIVIVCLICLAAASCSIRNAKITTDNKEQLLEDVTWSWFVSGDEVGLLSSALKDAAVTGKSIEGMTVGEVIEEQKLRAAEETVAMLAKARARGRLIDELRAKDKLDSYVNVIVVKKEFQSSAIYDGVFDSRIRIDMILDNLSDKEIKSVSGKIAFKDRSGRILMTRLITYYGLTHGNVRAGEKRLWISMERNNEMDPDANAFKDTPLGKLVFEWEPRHIVFADDKSLGYK